MMKHKLTAGRLNEALNEANMTAQELSKKSGVNKASISQYRHGTYKPSNISSGKMGKVLEATDQRDRDNQRDKARTKGYFFIALCPFISL